MAIRSTFVTVCGKHRAVMLSQFVCRWIGSAAVKGVKGNADNMP